MGGGFLSGFTKSPAKQYEEQDAPITFDDVAGLESVKADLQEIVDYLKEPEKFQRLGGRRAERNPVERTARDRQDAACSCRRWGGRGTVLHR